MSFELPKMEFLGLWPRTLRHSPVAISHILIVLSLEPVIIFFLLQEISTIETRRCPGTLELVFLPLREVYVLIKLHTVYTVSMTLQVFGCDLTLLPPMIKFLSDLEHLFPVVSRSRLPRPMFILEYITPNMAVTRSIQPGM